MRISERDVVSTSFRISSLNLALCCVLALLPISALLVSAVTTIDLPNSGYFDSENRQTKSFDGQNMKPVGGGELHPVLGLFENGRSVSTSDFRGVYPDHLDGSITVGDRTRRITYRKNLDLLSVSYKEIYYENSKRIVTAATPSDDRAFCYYHGAIDDDSGSYSTLNLCNPHVSGTVYMDGKHYVIDHLRLLPSYQYAPYSANYTCEHESKTVTGQADATYARRKRALGSRPVYYKKFITWKELYVELALVFDNSMFEKYGKDKKRLFERAKDLANFMNAYYQPVGIKVALVGVEIWSESDRIVVNTSGDATLDQFLRYRRVNLIHDVPNDHAQLLTNVTFNGGVVGKAMKGTMCSTDLSGAVIMDHDRFKSPAPIAATMSHEMGHNFGMEHDNDTCECPQQRCLMAASSSGAGNVYWSSCSMEYLSWSISHGADYCLRNKPPTAKEPLCGDGFVEDDEECDCGLPDVCDNPCCNAITCKFANGAVCANGGCCNLRTCQFMPLATACRETEDECDLPEFCNGKSEICPKNTYKQNGTPCQGSQAFCYNGTCGSHDSQCKLIWGPTGQNAARECYRLNEKGDAQGHCGLGRHDGSFVPCDNKDSMCGLLQCTHKTERTSYGDRSVVRMTSAVLHMNERFLNCHTAMIDLGFDRPNPGLVPSGAKCGEGKMCRGQKCMLVVDALTENPCPSNCHDSGVCNNFGHCHCISGYGGVDCSIPGLGGSIDSGPASTGAGRFNVGIGILIFLLVVLPLITVAVTFLYKKRVIRIPRFKIIDLLFKPRRQKSRPASAALSDISQARTRTFDSNSVSRKAPPVLAFRSDSQQLSPPRLSPRESVGILPSAAPYVAMYTAGSSTADPVAMTDFHVTPVGVHREPSFGSSAPRRPARPKVEVLEKLYYTDVASVPHVDYACINREAEAPPESLLSEVLTALEPDYGPAILPQRRAPPPPIEEETVENNTVSKMDDAKTASVKDKKRFFESAGSAKLVSGLDRDSSSTLKRSPKENAAVSGAKSIANEKKAAPKISDPSDPKIGGEPVAQASSLLVVPHLECQTLPRKKNSDTALSTGAAYRTRQMNQRKSSAIEEADWRKRRPTSNIVQRSQSSVSGRRPTIAPPPPPPQPSVASKPAITPSKPPVSAKPSLRLSKGDPTSAIPLVSNENFDSDSSSSSHGERNSTRRSASTENYYDVIASPVDEKEEIYADIDEFRAAVKPQPPLPATSNGSSKESPPGDRSLPPSAPGSKNQDGRGKYGNLESKKSEAK